MNQDGLALPVPQDPQYRRDPITGHWILTASERSHRPIVDSIPTAACLDVRSCAFCEGNEEETPPEILALRNGGSADTGGWTIRVVPNRYPAVRMGIRDVDPQSVKSQIARTCAGTGNHEVVIERPDHHWTITDLSVEHVANVFDVYRQRLRFLRTKRPLRYALVFKNVGQAAGASQEHAHSQILATSNLPPRIQDEVSGSERYYERNARCVFCETMEWEAKKGERVVLENEDFFAWCPYASRFAFEVWLAPKQHACRFEDIAPGKLGALGDMVRRLLIKLETMTSTSAYNYFIHTAPFAAGCDAYYHWHLEIAPRTAGLAGFEIGAGMYINSVPAEWAARQWRS